MLRTIRGWRLSLLLLVGAAPPAGAQAAAELGPSWRILVAEHRAALDSAGIVGATIAFVRDGELAAVDYYGHEDLEAGRPVDDGTVYHWASNTKTLTAVAVMQLRDRGLLRLDDPAIGTVPELRDVHDPYGPIDQVTLRHLLSHSAGFRNPTWPWDEGEAWQPFEPTEWSQLVAMMPWTRLHFMPGSRYGYSNPGIIFLGRTIERLSGDPYEAYVDKNIFDPLGMESAHFDATPWRLREDRSNSYRVVDGRPVPNGREFDTGITVSNGGLNATVRDVAKWAAFLAGRSPSRREAYDEVLARGSLEEMWRPVVTVADSSARGRVRMGLSFFLYEKDGRRLIGHTGSQRSFRSFILVDPAEGTAFLGAYNTADGDETAPDTDALQEALESRAIELLFAAAGDQGDRREDGR